SFQMVARVGVQNDVRRRVVGRRVHRVRAGEGARSGKTNIVRGDAEDSMHRPQPLTAPTSRPRAMNRSSAIAIAITGVIMIRMSTDMYHHCGPRVAFCAATVRGRVCAFELVRNNAIRYSFQAKTRTKRNVATRPGTAR